MRNSNIKQKTCKHPSCTLFANFNSKGFCFLHADEKKTTRKQKISRNKTIKRRVGALRTPEMAGMQKWYEERRKEMTGICIECGRYTSKDDDRYFRWSVCHIVPKKIAFSVATNVFNWLELCRTHHQEFDNTFDRAAKMKCFSEAKRKFQLFKDLIPPEELRKINPYFIDGKIE